ncbi:albusnodin/ikarugamycin family macrolactam cyclase [Jiangella mangrovi]|uniref:asparagine synthase (glutamine-hydrolyzing) n=1 Tax=Jiangella mangrovi TaxID=1524084 RepID=A0A7W9GTV6_9ACTN|nr:albusnodin/ikarugamycin family macrolactam cyclase [Jiangella mangrovi]MBB5789877.1 asparagine synthase (glutamine-hydrolyzing) [Jiangella mangrovi]
MMNARLFGGGTGLLGTARIPAGARLLTTYPATWVVGSWPAGHVRTDERRAGTLVVLGPCSATARDLELLPDELPDWASTTWSGAYTLVFARRDGSVTVLTDPACAAPIYITRADNHGIVWASSSRALAGLTGATVDDLWLAANLMAPHRTLPGASAWTGVELVPPGHRLSMNAGRSPTVHEAWRRPQAQPGRSVDQIGKTLEAAVSCRIAGNKSSTDLSGGLDSTTLAVLAARRQPVTAVTVHPVGMNRGGDLDYARRTAAEVANLHHLELPLSDAHLPYSNISGIPATDEPAPSTTTWSRLSAELDVLRAADVVCHLTGDGGDTLFAAPPVYLTDLLRAGRLLRVAHHAQGWARLRHTSPWAGLRDAVSGNAAALAGLSQATGLTREAQDRVSALLGAAPKHGLGRADEFLIDDVRHTARTARTEAQLADTFGIALENPYLDARLLEAVLTIPVRHRASPHRYKPMLSDAATGLVPDRVRLRGAKGTFAADHHRGLRQNLRQFLDLADGELAGRGLIRPSWVRRQLNQAAFGLEVAWSRIAPVIAAEIWLRSVQRDEPTAWVYSAASEGVA